MSAEKSGPLMQRFTLPDGSTIILPAGSKIHTNWPKDGSEAEKKAWLSELDKQPLSGTY